jgi:hypothetical protein
MYLKSLPYSVVSAMALIWATNSLAQERAAPAQRLDQIAVAFGGPRLTYTNPQGKAVHVFPTVSGAHALQASAAASGPLLYHSGGPIMPNILIYNIFWVPPTLQNGKPANLPSYYPAAMNNLAFDYGGHSIDSNNTQYYQIISGTAYVHGLSLLANGSFGGSFTDTAPYPASDCADSVTSGNCITDTDIQNEVNKVVAAKGWVGGLNKIFNIYTAVGEGSCFDSSGTSCAYTSYCAYHGSIGSGSTSIIYSNEPYAEAPYCQGGKAPNHADSDAAASVTSHEITESITDPNLNAWFTSGGYEIGDLCAWNYGTNTFDNVGGVFLANQQWNGRNYEIQMMWDNHQNKCVQVGP